MSKSYRKDLKNLIEKLEAQGWRVETTRKGHLLCYAPDGKGLVTMSGTPSDHRSWNNTIARLRQNGAVL